MAEVVYELLGVIECPGGSPAWLRIRRHYIKEIQRKRRTRRLEDLH